MAGLNKVFIFGRLGHDVESKQVNGKTVARMSVATSEKYKDKETTTWHSIVVWGKLAELCQKYLSKGSQALIEGRIQTRTYEKDGEKKYVTEIVASNVQFAGARSADSAEPDGSDWGGDQ